MTTIRKADDDAAFLGLVPTLVEHQPSRSVVVVAFAGNRSQAAMRFDEAALDKADVLGAHIAQVLGTNAPDADGVVIVGYTTRHGDYRRLRELADFLNRGWRVKGLFQVGPERWDNLGTGEGGAVADIPVPEGFAVAASVTAGSELPTLSRNEIEATRALWGELVTQPTCDAYIEGLAALVPFRDESGHRPDFHEIFIGRADRVGHHAALELMYDVAKEVAVAFPESWVAHLGAAWAAWALGRGSWAGVHAEHALNLTPPDRSATALFIKMLDRGIIPEWAKVVR